MDYISHYESPLGGITLASDGEALVGLWFDGQAHFGLGLSDEREERDLPVFAEARRWLDTYFGGEVPGFTPSLAPRGSACQVKVWKALLTIPYGQTVTYGAIARALRSSPRAVGGAVGRNPVSLIVPCHRVLGVGNRLTGYAGGLDRKQALLKLEGSLADESRKDSIRGGPAAMP